MKDYGDSDNIWTELVKILRSKVFDRDLQIKRHVSTTSPLANMSRFLLKLEHCSGENATILPKPSKLKIKDLGIDPNSREVVTVIVFTFTGHLGDWAANHADEIFKLDIYDALTAYVRVSFSNELL